MNQWMNEPTNDWKAIAQGAEVGKETSQEQTKVISILEADTAKKIRSRDT